MQPGMPQGFGTIGPGRDADLHPARQPGQRLRLLRGLRASGAPPDARRRAAAPARRCAPRAPAGFDVARPASGSSRAAGSDVEDGPLRRHAGRRRRARTCVGDLAHANCADRRARGRHRGRRRAAPSTVMVLERRPDVTEPGRLTHVDDDGRGAHGRRVGQGRHGAHGDRHRPGARLGRGRRRCCAAAACPRATRSPSRGSPASRPPSAPPTSCRCATRSRSTASTVDLVVDDDAVAITATVRTADRTGVEMEALTCVAVAGARADRHGQGGRPGRGRSPTSGSRRRPAGSPAAGGRDRGAP